MLPKTLCRFAIIVLLVAHVGSVATARTFDKIIAYVNEEVITKWELENVVKQRAMELQHSHNFSEREAMEKARQESSDLLDRLIRQLLLVETALTLKIEVTEQELMQYLQNFKEQAQIKTDEEFRKQLKTEGLTMITFREQVKRNLMAEKLVMGRIRPKIQIRESDIQKFFEENRAQFSTKTDEIHLRHIFIAFKPSEADREVASQKVNIVLQKAKDGEDFEALAKDATSDEKSKSAAGALVELPRDQIEKLSNLFRTALSELNDGEISEPIENNDGFYLFKVERKTDLHIEFRYLVIPLKPSEEAIQKAQEQADSLHLKLNQGEDFNSLAQQYSNDSQTRERGGDLGPRLLSDLSPETRKIVEELAAGEYTKPFKTEFGLHIFKIDNRALPELSDLEKDQIRIFLSQQQFQEEWKTYTDMLLGNAYVKISPLDEENEKRKESDK